MSTPTIALLIMTDGRDELLARTVRSFFDMTSGNLIEVWVMVDGGGGRQRTCRIVREAIDEMPLAKIPPQPVAIGNDLRNGFGGAIGYAWRALADYSNADYVFHLEDDFTFNRQVDLDAMAGVLAGYPHLAQMALRRQAWNEAERAAGGVIEQHPEDYTERGAMVVTDTSLVTRVNWLEHARFFTTNPCLYRRRRPGGHPDVEMATPWPDGPNSEGRYGIRLREAGYRFGFWGKRSDAPWVHHIGETRAGNGY